MAFLYLAQQGATIRRRGDSLLVELDGQTLLEQEIHRIEALCIFGRVNLTIPAIELLLDRGIETAFLTLSGRLKGQLTPARPANITIRLEQFRRFFDPAIRLAMARTIVGAKLANSAEVLRRFRYNHPDFIGEEPLATIQDMISAAGAADSLERLRGLEGMGAKAYFSALAKMNLSGLPFDGRSSRPPVGPVNAVLSLGYVLLGNELQHLLDAVGLDPYLGFYHEPADRRASLAVDLIEELRHPLIDRFCLTELNRGVFREADFQADEQADPPGTRLTPEAFRRFLAAYDAWMNAPGPTGRPAPRQILRSQVEAFCRWLRDNHPYTPYRFES